MHANCMARAHINEAECNDGKSEVASGARDCVAMLIPAVQLFRQRYESNAATAA